MTEVKDVLVEATARAERIHPHLVNMMQDMNESGLVNCEQLTLLATMAALTLGRAPPELRATVFQRFMQNVAVSMHGNGVGIPDVVTEVEIKEEEHGRPH